MSIKGWWQRTKDWLSRASGRVRALFDELPDARELLAELDAEALVRYGDAAAAVEPEHSKLLRAVTKVANLLDFIAPVAGIGSDKERALVAKVRQIAAQIGVADEAFDQYWQGTLRPDLVRYIERKKAAVS